MLEDGVIAKVKTGYYLKVEPFYLETKLLGIGLTSVQMNGVEVRIYDRERTSCDVLRYEKKIEREVFSNAIQRYLIDSKKNKNFIRIWKYI